LEGDQFSTGVFVSVSREAVDAALATVIDPEIRRPITEVDMVKEVKIDGGKVTVGVYLTISACPMQDKIVGGVKDAVAKVRDVTSVEVELDVMSPEQRTALREKLQGPTKEIRFNQPGNLTRIYAIASGKGGVGKSSVTVNLAAALSAQGLTVGILDADIYGHSIPDMLGITEAPLKVENLIMPPQGHGIRVMSMLHLKPNGRHEPVAMRGPMLHRYLESFLSEVWWGDLDILLLDLPPGTGDIAISTAHLLPQSELIIVTTPQPAAADVAIRAGMLSPQLNQRVAGVIENMSAFACPHCGEPIDMFGSGGGQMVAKVLSENISQEVALLGKIPFDPKLREGGDNGQPLVLAHPDAAAAKALAEIANKIGSKPRGLVGMNLGVTPSRN
jgi:ATP-binding protein involved in chromosome partitioning